MSEFNNHRYTLKREWLGSGGILNWIMLNPSTADEVFDDPTIRKCCGFAKRWGFRGIVVTNLFAFRATDPKEMKAVAAKDFTLATGGPGNDLEIWQTARSADLIAVAWGTHGNFMKRAAGLMGASLAGLELHCIGLTKDGHPMHPCMAGYTEAPLLFRGAVA